MMFKRTRLLLASVFMLALAGCSTPMPSATADVQPGEDSYFVMGVQPHNMALYIDQVAVRKDGLVYFVNTLPLHQYGQSDGDFIVVKVAGGQRYGIRSASAMLGHSIFGMYFKPCKDTLVFDVPAGKAVYITNVEYYSNGAGMLTSTHHDDFSAAQEYVKMHYPLLAGKLEQGSATMAPLFLAGLCR